MFLYFVSKKGYSISRNTSLPVFCFFTLFHRRVIHLSQHNTSFCFFTLFTRRVIRFIKHHNTSFFCFFTLIQSRQQEGLFDLSKIGFISEYSTSLFLQVRYFSRKRTCFFLLVFLNKDNRDLRWWYRGPFLFYFLSSFLNIFSLVL